MAIEDSLERIAIALEAIVKSKQGVEPMSNDSLTKVEIPKTRPGKKVEEVKADIVDTVEKVVDKIAGVAGTTEDDFLPEEETETDLDIKWPDVNKKLFGMLEEVRDAKSPEAAKALCGSLMKKYSGGQKFGPGTVAPKSYKALLAEIEAQLEALNG